MIDKVIISLFDDTGNWSAPYREAGYRVIQVDLAHGVDILTDALPHVMAEASEGKRAWGVLAAPPCTHFASSGAWKWKEKENMIAPDGLPFECDNLIEHAVSLVLTTLFIVELAQPEWWVLEQPVGRIRKLVPEVGKPRLTFQPWWYGDPYTKKTLLYGNFNPNLKKTPVLPLYGSMAHQTSSSNKRKRSATPMGFARAFFHANP